PFLLWQADHRHHLVLYLRAVPDRLDHRPVPDPVHGPPGRPPLSYRQGGLQPGLDTADLPRPVRRAPHVHGQVDHRPALSAHRRPAGPGVPVRSVDAEYAGIGTQPDTGDALTQPGPAMPALFTWRVVRRGPPRATRVRR